MQLLDRFLTATEAAIEAASLGQEPSQLLAQLQPITSELREYWDILHKRPDNRKGSLNRRVKAREQYDREQFIVQFSSGEPERIIGWWALAKRLGISDKTIRVYFSNSKTKGSFVCKKLYYNPTTGVDDLLRVTRVRVALEEPQRLRGRPNKRLQYETDPRLGSEFSTGTHLAPPAKTVPKRTNRRTATNVPSKLPK
jgi:hypothetical protein